MRPRYDDGNGWNSLWGLAQYERELLTKTLGQLDHRRFQEVSGLCVNVFQVSNHRNLAFLCPAFRKRCGVAVEFHSILNKDIMQLFDAGD